jgi:uncharacterized Zn finger protein
VNKRSAFGRTWWARRWIEALEEIVDPGRLQRGRSYARSGHVLSADEDGQGITALVQGSRRSPYLVHIELAHLSDTAWNRLLEMLASRAAFAARLLNGEMPGNLDDVCTEAGVSLFPKTGKELITSCSCPDWSNPCKHVAAVYYVLGERFDDDPFLLFRLRGRTQEQVMRALLTSGGEGEQVEETAGSGLGPPPDASVPAFWQCARPLEDIAIAIELPKVRLPVLRRLGEPAFGASVQLVDKLGPHLDEVSRAAIAAAYREAAPVADEGNGDQGQ